MAHLFQFSEELIINLDLVETFIVNMDRMQHDRDEGLSLMNVARERIAYKSLDDPTMEETWERLQKIAARTQDTESQ